MKSKAKHVEEASKNQAKRRGSGGEEKKFKEITNTRTMKEISNLERKKKKD